MSAITRILPKRRLSRWVGKFMHFRGPRWWAHLSVKAFASLYKINLEEAEKPSTEYPSIGEFFVRRLKPGIRPVGASWAVHPADSKITQAYAIDDGTLIQAKGLTYKLSEFTQDPNCDKKWAGGFFLTYYLCPTDYHRVHSPVDGEIVSARYMPGQLWPVNEWSTTNIPNLFSVNERVLVEIETDLGPRFDDSIQGNQKGPHMFEHKIYSSEIPTHKGSELGMFRMGSTVVVLYPPMFRQKFEGQMNLGPAVRVNASLIK